MTRCSGTSRRNSPRSGAGITTTEPQLRGLARVDIGGQVVYQNVKHRWNYAGVVGRLPYISAYQQGFIDQASGSYGIDQVLLRFYQDQIGGIVQYPLSTIRRLEFGLTGTRQSYRIDVYRYYLNSFNQVIAQDRIRPETPVEGETLWRPQGDDFVLARVGVGEAAAVHGYTLAGPETVTVPLTGPAVVLVLTGGVAVAGATDAVSLARGEAAYASPDEGSLTFSGSGIVYVSTTP